MTAAKEIRLELFADYFQFYIQDEKAEGDLSNSWTNEAVDLLLATTEGTIGIGTVRNMTVPVTIKIFETEPPVRDDAEHIIDQINECDIQISSGKIVIAGCTDYFPDAVRMELSNGTYRTRIYYGNLDKITEDGLDGEDFYEIHLWPTREKQNVQVVKTRQTGR